MRENKSPWLHNFNYDRQTFQMKGNVNSDITIVGGGIAGATTAFMLLKHTDKKVCLIEGDKVGHGATGHNAGYVVAEFEKSFKEIVKDFGLDMARRGQQDIENAFKIFQDINKEIGLSVPQYSESVVAFSNKDHFIESLHEEYLKNGKIKHKIYVNENSTWKQSIPENFLEYIDFVNEEKLVYLIKTEQKKGSAENIFQAVMIEEVAICNSATFTEKVIKYCLEYFKSRFIVYEKTFVHSIRLLQNGRVIADSLYGVCISDKVILCTNGFENFNIYGPLNTQIDTEFHHNVSGLIGYMVGTFFKGDEEMGGVFYDQNFSHKNLPYEAGPYIYYTKRKMLEDDEQNNFLLSIGGPEIKLHDRKIYKKDHEVDEKIYQDLEKFQEEKFGVKNKSFFKWHGLMGYTKSGVRLVGQDKKFLDLYYNLGCNGVGILPSVAGALRIARLISGEKLEKSIFDPK